MMLIVVVFSSEEMEVILSILLLITATYRPKLCANTEQVRLLFSLTMFNQRYVILY